MQEILKQKSKKKNKKTFGAINNAYEIYHRVQVATAENLRLITDVWKESKS